MYHHRCNGSVLAIGKPINVVKFGDVSDAFNNCALSNLKYPCTSVDVIFDRYDNVSINMERGSTEVGTIPVIEVSLPTIRNKTDR